MPMTTMDWSRLNWIQDLYRTALILNPTMGICHYPLIQPIQSTYEFFNIPIHISAMRLITYWKQVPEFCEMNCDEQIYLVKSNCLTLTFLHSLFIYDAERKVYHEPDTNDALFSEQDWMNVINEEFHQEMKRIHFDFLDLIHSDEKILKLFFLLILFSDSCHLSSSNMPLTFSLKLFHRQSIYNDLLFKYCLQCYGMMHASRFYLRYVSKIMQIQRLVRDLRHWIQHHLDLDLLSPLIRSLL